MWGDRAFVEPPSRHVQIVCSNGRAGGLCECGFAGGGEVGDAGDTPAVEFAFQRRPDAWNAAQRHHLHELCLTVDRDEQHAVRFGVGGRHFRDQFVRSDAHRAGDVIALCDLGADPGADAARLAPLAQCAGYVHVAFIDGYLFDLVGDLAEHFVEDAPRHHAVIAHIDGQEHAVRT